MLLFLAANVVLINAALTLLPATSRYDVTAFETYKMLRVRTEADSWEPMRYAWEYLQHPDSRTVYDAIFFDREEKFQYPLTSLLPIESIQRITGDETVRYGLLDAISLAAMAVMAVAVGAILAISAGAARRSPLPRAEQLLLFALGAGATLTFYPAVKSFTVGQVQTWSNALFAITLFLWMRQARRSAGVATGLVCITKPQMGLFLVWGVLRRQWWFAAAIALIAAAAGIAALVLYGFADNWDYLSVLRFISRHGEAYYPNQSINGLLNRMLDNGGNLAFDEHGFPPYNAAVYILTLLTSVIIIGAALFPPGRRAAGTAVDLSLAALSFTIASPVAWEHHYGILAPIYAATAPAMLARRIFGVWTAPWLAASYLLTSNYIHAAREAADTPFTPVQSYLFAGALMLLIALYRLRSVEAAHPAPEIASAGSAHETPAARTALGEA